MKNIRFYAAQKYSTEEYTEMEAYIYKTEEKEFANSLTLQQVKDKELIGKIRELSDWNQGNTELDKGYEILVYNGRRYYREIGVADGMIYQNPADEKRYVYVTSIVFEPEPEFEENSPEDSVISQYPLEDILDKFFCYCRDFYEDENGKDPLNSYVEFESPDIENIRNLLSILGKHVYNQEDGEYIKLVIE